jgi:16S rRNA (uracil1498-N3)-methyltransferase
MNLVLLFDDDFVSDDLVRLTGRRRDHVLNVHRAAPGDELVVGVAGGKIGTGTVTEAGEAIEMRVRLDRDPPPALPITLIVALPRPKVLNRVIASVTSMGVKRLYLINAWRVEKSYWKSPRLAPENLREQSILGLEQARDTVLPEISLQRFFRPFLETFVATGRKLVAHPYATEECPRSVGEATVVVGPEGGFIQQELESLERAGFALVTMGPRILPVETAVAALIGRLMGERASGPQSPGVSPGDQ